MTESIQQVMGAGSGPNLMLNFDGSGDNLAKPISASGTGASKASLGRPMSAHAAGTSYNRKHKIV